MKKMRKLLVLIIILNGLVIACGGVNQKALRKPLTANTKIGIIVQPYEPERELVVIRKFLQKGFRVKAIKAVILEELYPTLREMFKRQLKMKGSIGQLHKLALMSDLNTDLALNNELKKIKDEIDVEYLIFIHQDGLNFNSIGLDLSNYEVIYSHTYRPNRFLWIPLPYRFWLINLLLINSTADIEIATDIFLPAMMRRY